MSPGGGANGQRTGDDATAKMLATAAAKLPHVELG